MSHGGAFRKFKGLPAPTEASRYSDDFYQGLPCIHTAHAGSTVWRDGLTHSCQLCVEDISKGTIGFSLDRLTPTAQPKARKFWSRVDLSSLDDCWQWTAPNIGSYIGFTWERRPIRKRFHFHPIHIATWLTWGDIGRASTISRCGHRRCVNPLHNIPEFLGDIDVDTLIDLDALHLDYQLLLRQLKSFHQQSLDKNSTAPNAWILERYSSKAQANSTSDISSAYEQALLARDKSLLNETHQLFKSEQ